MLKALTAAGLLACSLTTLWPGRAAAQLDNQIADLNRQALDAYQSLDIDGARAKLERAIKLAQRSNHAGPTVAQSFLSLGLVYVAGMNDQEQGLAAFVNAICMQRDVQLDPLLSTPAVKQVFAQAQNDTRAGACGPDAGPTAAPPAVAPRKTRKPADVDLSVPDDSTPASTTDVLDAETDAECPPGMRCGGTGERDEDSQGFARFFASLQLVSGFSLLRSGMEADSAPPPLAGHPAIADVFNASEFPNPMTMLNEPRYVFNVESPWVPDGDSFDDLEPRGTKSLQGNCTADGIRTGPAGVPDPGAPGQTFQTINPSKYCVRVAQPGFVPGFALRANIGYFVTHGFALSVPLRFQFDAGEGTLSHMLLGLRGELLFSRMTSATGTAVSWFFGGTYGQIQARPAAPAGSTLEGPYAISGPFGVHTGVNIRLRLHRNVGVVISPEIDLQLPALMPHADVSAGIETAF